MFTARVEVRLKPGVADPEGDNTLKALALLGFEEVEAVRSVRVFEIDLKAKGNAAARKELEEMCRKLLANPVIHDYRITLLNPKPSPDQRWKGAALR